MTAEPDRRQNRRFRNGPRALAALLPRAVGDAFRRRGFAEAGILTHWPDIVGSHIAAETAPERLSFARGARRDGTLHVRVAGALATELQHLAPQLIERINTYFGYAAVGRLAISQAPLPAAPEPRQTPTPAAPDPAADAALADGLGSIADDGLKGALFRLGRAVRNRGRTTER